MILHSWSKNSTSVSKPSAQTGLIVGNKGYCRIPLHAWTDLGVCGGGGGGGAEAFPLLLAKFDVKKLSHLPFWKSVDPSLPLLLGQRGWT